MTAIVAATRRIWVMMVMFSSLQVPVLVGTGIQRWTNSLWLHRSQILFLTSVNTIITAGNELVTRELNAPFSSDPSQSRFFVRDSNNNLAIHRQSLINIWMTVFASCLGGPVFFLHRRRNRFLFFTSFGIFNSVLSQSIAGILLQSGTIQFFHRLLFDLTYCGTIKFFFFEVGRKPLLAFQRRVLPTSAVRITQDFCTTFFRVVVLNGLGFKG